MSGWLKSVNSLLEQLDGKAETTVADDAQESAEESFVEEYTDDEFDDFDDFDDDEEADEFLDSLEEEKEDEKKEKEDGAYNDQDEDEAMTGGGAVKEEESNSNDNDTGMSMEMDPQRRQPDNETVSDISLSESGSQQQQLVDEETGEVIIDLPPKTPSRQDSNKDALVQQQQHKSEPSLNSKRSLDAGGGGGGGGPAAVSRTQDVSPRPPFRSLLYSDEGNNLILPAGAGFLDDDADEEEQGTATTGDDGKLLSKSDRDESLLKLKESDSVVVAAAKATTNATALDDSIPPKLPERQPSLQVKVKWNEALDTGTALVAAETKAKMAALDAPTPLQQVQVMAAVHPKSNNSSKPPPPSASSAGTGTDNNNNTKELQKLTAKIQSLQSLLKKSNNELKTTQADGKLLRKQVNTLNAKMETAEAEITAQRQELSRAGERMEKDRKRAQEDREDFLDDHDEELDQLKVQHDAAMAEQKEQYEKQLKDLRTRLETEEKKRMQEGGDWTMDLEDALQRERDALLKLNEVESEKNTCQSKVSKLEMYQTALQTKLESTAEASKTAAEREREAEDKLDSALSLHARQISQRQERESVLEQTIFDLGSALTVAHQKGTSKSKQQPPQPSSEDNFKDQYERAAEELDTLKVQLDLETLRREALQQELNEINKERTEDASSSQARQRQHDRKVADLESTVSRLQTSLRAYKSGKSEAQASADNGKASQIAQELEESKSEIARLSEQLVRQQGRVEASKSEILAMKGRLQSANARADEAETSLVSQVTAPASTGRMYDMESGGLGFSGTTRQRRIKGGAGRVRGGSSSVRSVRSALNIGPGRTSPALEQVAGTIDAIDSWMIETGSFMRHEPLARVGFLLYLVTLHVWSFALVIFHETEVPHGDFGSMGGNPRQWRAHP
jgi:hypothetical protein